MDLVFVPGWISNIELAWELPEFAASSAGCLVSPG
jgi:hypothetical protein